MSNSNWNGKNGPLLIAEVGGNHEGDFNYAKKLVKLAIKSQVDIVKLQLYTGSNLVSPVESKTRYEHFKKFKLSKKEHIYLAEMCKSSNTKYLASVWDLKMLEWIDDYLDYYKIGSGDLTAYPIIKEFTKIGKPIILSTGLSNINEIKDSIKFIQEQNSIYKNKENLAVLQCTSTYPTIDEEANLRAINTLKSETGMTVGYSDHTLGNEALKIAYICGAQVMEFHFTDSREGKIFRDHKISLTYDEVLSLIKEIKKINILLGIKEKKATRGEIKSNHLVSFRRAIYSNKLLKAGHILKEEDLVFLRPNHGLDIRKYKNVIGKKIKKDTQPYEKLELISEKE